jgi:hypothetical protein
MSLFKITLAEETELLPGNQSIHEASEPAWLPIASSQRVDACSLIAVLRLHYTTPPEVNHRPDLCSELGAVRALLEPRRFPFIHHFLR